ncbi:MAG: hypothetical protein Q8R55_07610 [Candidatus Taylorbacteria bacterium]|nr:hypothetical protein [Candidatus Taylorbacteria bacterium]
MQGMSPVALVLLPTIPIIELLHWESALQFYHSGRPVDHFGMIKVVIVGTIEFGLLGWCIDLIKHRKVKS